MRALVASSGTTRGLLRIRIPSSNSRVPLWLEKQRRLSKDVVENPPELAIGNGSGSSE